VQESCKKSPKSERKVGHATGLTFIPEVKYYLPRSYKVVTKERKMTVSELIKHLQNYPGDMRVLTLGYEGGYDDIGRGK
jgi:hypothetical protein